MMIQCEECGSYISDRATSCPHCGCPLVDNYNIGYEIEEGARQSRIDQANRISAQNRKWKIKCLVICVVLFFASYGIGKATFPNAVHNENASFAPIAIAILSGIFLVYSASMALWKHIVIGFIVPHAFFIYMLLISFSGGYLFGCIAGM